MVWPIIWKAAAVGRFILRSRHPLVNECEFRRETRVPARHGLCLLSAARTASWHAPAAVSTLSKAGRFEVLPAADRKADFVRAIVLLDGALEQVERRLLLAAIGKEDSLVVPRLRVGVGGWLLSASCAIRSRSVRAQLEARFQQIAAITGRYRHTLTASRRRQSCLRAAAARASHRPPIPTASRRMNRQPVGLSQLHECPGAGAERIVSGIERQGHVAFIGRLFEHSGITIHNADGKMGWALSGGVSPFPARLICLPEFAAFQVVGDQLAGSEDPIGSSCSARSYALFDRWNMGSPPSE